MDIAPYLLGRPKPDGPPFHSMSCPGVGRGDKTLPLYKTTFNQGNAKSGKTPRRVHVSESPNSLGCFWGHNPCPSGLVSAKGAWGRAGHASKGVYLTPSSRAALASRRRLRDETAPLCHFNPREKSHAGYGLSCMGTETHRHKERFFPAVETSKREWEFE